MTDTGEIGKELQRTNNKPGPKRGITRKIRTAIELMVWEGLKRCDAAKKAGLRDNSLYVALRRSDVKALYLSECEVLRVSGRAKRLHRLDELAAQDENKNAAVAAIKAAEDIGDDPITASSRVQAPGIIIVLGRNREQQRIVPTYPSVVDVTPRPASIEHEPIIEQVIEQEHQPIEAQAELTEVEEQAQTIDQWLAENATRIEPGVRLAPPNTAGVRDLAQNQPQQTRLRYRGARRRVGPDD